MDVQEPWFTEIARGLKTVEGRTGSLGKPAARGIVAGKTIAISCGESSVDVTVVAVRHYETLEAYLEAEGWGRVAPHTGSDEKAAAAYAAIVMEKGGETVRVFSPERVAARGGINAIELRVCH